MTKEREKGLKTAAVLKIKAPGRMRKRGRKMIADWLRRVATHFEARGELYTKGDFTAKYLYE